MNSFISFLFNALPYICNPALPTYPSPKEREPSENLLFSFRTNPSNAEFNFNSTRVLYRFSNSVTEFCKKFCYDKESAKGR